MLNRAVTVSQFRIIYQPLDKTVYCVHIILNFVMYILRIRTINLSLSSFVLICVQFYAEVSSAIAYISYIAIFRTAGIVTN